MYIYMCMCVYVRIYVCMYMYMYKYMYMCVYVYVCVYVYMCVYVYVCVHVCHLYAHACGIQGSNSGSLTGTWGSLGRLEWLASKSGRSTSLYQPRSVGLQTEIVSTTLHTPHAFDVGAGN